MSAEASGTVSPRRASGRPQRCKIVFLGEQGVGKTSIIQRFLFNRFDDRVDATIGVDFQAKTLKLGERSFRLQLWDTAGQERFRSLVPGYIRDATAAIIVYDVTKKESFERTAGWIQEVRDGRGSDTLLYLVGNKSDLTGESRAVDEAEGSRKAEDEGIGFIEASAKTGSNIPELFERLAAQLPATDQAASAPTSAPTSALTPEATDNNVKLAAPTQEDAGQTCRC